MKIIHSADQHLDSKMEANLSKEKAKERNAEIRKTFVRMVDYAEENQVAAILLAGDLFDRKIVSKTDQEVVKNAIDTHPDIDFFYIRGNHDDNSFLASLDEKPDNLKLFEDKFTSYQVKDSDVYITGAELTGSGSIYNTLSLNMDKFNIVMLHGQESNYEGKDKTEIINLTALSNRGIDYLALGHVHEHKEGKLDARGTYAYCGALEGRGFDECGDHGFILLDIDEEHKTYSHEFVPFAYRKLHLVEVDISNLESVTDIESKVNDCLQEAAIDDKDLVKVELVGSVSMDANVDIDYLTKAYDGEYYMIKFKDRTNMHVDYNAYALDESLKGEFVRTVQASDLDEDTKAKVIRMGIGLLKGESI